MLMQKDGNQIYIMDRKSEIVNHGITFCHNGIIIKNPDILKCYNDCFLKFFFSKHIKIIFF